MRRLTALLLAAVLLGVVGFAAIREASHASAASGPCDPLSPGVSAIEADLFAAVNSWRAASMGAPAMTLSGPANAAAQWFAEAMIAGETYGHSDVYGREWSQRLADCGFPGRFGSGEALAGFGSSNPAYGSTPDQALAMMTSDPNHQNAVNAQWPNGSPVVWQCAGVGYATNPSPSVGDLRYAWVVLGVQTFSACPSVAATPTPPPPASPTVTATLTPTATATVTATPTPTPSPEPTPEPVLRPLWMAAPLISRESLTSDDGEASRPPEPSATPEPEPTATPEPEPTATPEPPPPAACGGTIASFTSINKLSEVIVIGGSGDMTGWRIESETSFTGGPGEVYFFPSGYFVSGSVTVRAGTTADDLNPGELWWGTPAGVWNNATDDDAFLYDCEGTLRDTWEDDIP